MRTTTDELLIGLHGRYQDIFNKTLDEEMDKGLRGTVVQTMTDLGSCICEISTRPEKEVFDLSIREYQYSLIAACHGSYRQAFASLRLSFELWLAAISFSGAEKELRAWRARKQDIVWNKLISKETGVLSISFVSLFCESLEEKAPHFQAISERLYRECSEYVHGNHHTHLALPDDLNYDQIIFRDWCSKVETFKLVCLFCFAFRYADIFSGTSLTTIGHPIGDTLGHIPEIRQLSL